MRMQRNTLLAGIAALALIAGTGFASAQQTGKDQTGGQPGRSHAAMQHMNKGPAGKMGQSARTESKGKMGRTAEEENRKSGMKSGMNEQKSSRQAAEHRRGNESAKAKSGKNHMAQTERRKEGAMARREGSKNRTMAEEHGRKFGKGSMAEREHNRMQHAAQGQRERNRMQNTAERGHKGLEGLQGNASGNNVQFSEHQRTEIRNTVIDARGAPRVNNVSFNVAVGTVIPRGSVHIVPVPPTLVRIEPAWRGFLYFVYEDEVVVVNPHSMRIVAVVYA